MSNALEYYHNFLLVIERWTLVVAGNEKACIILFQQGDNDLATVFTIAAAGGLFQDDVCFSFFYFLLERRVLCWLAHGFFITLEYQEQTVDTKH